MNSNYMLIILFISSFFVSSITAQSNGTSSNNETVSNSNDTSSNNDSVTQPPEAGGTDPPAAVIELDTTVGCYCPGDSQLGSFSFEEAKAVQQVIDSKRREAQQQYSVSTIPEDVPVEERVKVPTADVLSQMFPDLGDGFVIDTWISSLSEITRPAIKEITNLTATKMSQRLSSAAAVRLIRSKFDYSAYAVSPPATAAPAAPPAEEPAATSPPEDSPTQPPADNNDQVTDPPVTEPPADDGRKKRALTTTTVSPPRVQVVSVIPNPSGYGIKAGNDTSLNNSVLCNSCGHASTIKRKFLYFSTLFEDALLDVNTAEFKAKKLDLESKIDDMIYNYMILDEDLFRKGYWGSNILSLFRSSSDQLGAGRKKRSYIEGGTGAEVELSFRSGSVTDEIIETMFDNGTLDSLKGDSPLAVAECLVSSLDHDPSIFVRDDESINSVPVGEQLYLRCHSGYIMDRSYDTTLKGRKSYCLD